MRHKNISKEIENSIEEIQWHILFIYDDSCMKIKDKPFHNDKWTLETTLLINDAVICVKTICIDDKYSYLPQLFGEKCMYKDLN